MGGAQDNRRFINGVFWILRTGAPWRDLPPSYGKWSTVHQRFCRWRDNGIWEKILEALIDAPDFEWLMIDPSHCKVHPHAAGEKVAIRIWAVQKEVQHQDSPCRGFVWYAGQNPYHRSHSSWLQGRCTPYWRNNSRESCGRQRLWYIGDHPPRFGCQHEYCYSAKEKRDRPQFCVNLQSKV